MPKVSLYSVVQDKESTEMFVNKCVDCGFRKQYSATSSDCVLCNGDYDRYILGYKKCCLEYTNV